jgi:hypothetical protein
MGKLIICATKINAVIIASSGICLSVMRVFDFREAMTQKAAAKPKVMMTMGRLRNPSGICIGSTTVFRLSFIMSLEPW